MAGQFFLVPAGQLHQPIHSGLMERDFPHDPPEVLPGCLLSIFGCSVPDGSVAHTTRRPLGSNLRAKVE